MGLTVLEEPVSADGYDGPCYTVRIKDNVATADGWHLWITVYEDGDFVAEGSVEVADIQDATIEAAGRGFLNGILCAR